MEREGDRQSLAHVAAQIGDRLAAVFDSTEWELLEGCGASLGAAAFLVIESSDEAVLALPWELVDWSLPVWYSSRDVALQTLSE